MAPTPLSAKKGVKRTSISPAPKASPSPAPKSHKKSPVPKASISPAVKSHLAACVLVAGVLDGVELSDELSKSCKKMLSITLPFALAAASDKRSPEMVQVVDMVRESLDGVQQRLKSAVIEEQGRIDELHNSRDGFTDAITAAQGVLAASAEVVASKKKGVEDTEAASKAAFGALRTSRSALEEIANEDVTGEASLKVAEDAVKILLPALTTEWEPTGANAVRKKLMQYVNSASSESSGSLILSFASGIEKVPADRGPFDGVAIDQMQKCLTERFEKLTKNRDTLGERKSALEVAALKAQQDADTAQDSELAASDEKSSAEEKHAEAARAAKIAKDAEENFEPNLKRIEAVRIKKEKALLRFQEHNMSCFAKLADRVSDETSENVISPVEDVSDSAPAVPQVDVENMADR